MMVTASPEDFGGIIATRNIASCGSLTARSVW